MSDFDGDYTEFPNSLRWNAEAGSHGRQATAMGSRSSASSSAVRATAAS